MLVVLVVRLELLIPVLSLLLQLPPKLLGCLTLAAQFTPVLADILARVRLPADTTTLSPTTA